MKHNIFLSYKYTGVTQSELDATVKSIETLLHQQGHNVFCFLSHEAVFRQQGVSYDEILAFCISKQQGNDIFLAFINHEEPSNGMREELQQAIILGQTIIVCIKKGLSYNEFRTVAQRTIEFQTFEELYIILEKMQL